MDKLGITFDKCPLGFRGYWTPYSREHCRIELFRLFGGDKLGEWPNNRQMDIKDSGRKLPKLNVLITQHMAQNMHWLTESESVVGNV